RPGAAMNRAVYTKIFTGSPFTQKYLQARISWRFYTAHCTTPVKEKIENTINNNTAILFIISPVLLIESQLLLQHLDNLSLILLWF
ncbi:MAG: hypothetical protein LWX10_11940, partial [Spirochaetia bacterium]|nr:hypothetical protein [Spirochaetia bacterium]